MTQAQIAEGVFALPLADWVTISGGNPALHDCSELVSTLQEAHNVAVETQGSIWKPWLAQVNMLTVSPKPPSSTMHLNTQKLLPDFMRTALTNHSPVTMCLKVPVSDEADLDFAAGVHHEYPGVPFFVSVVTEMGGLDGAYADGHVDSRDEILGRWKWVTERVLARGVEFSDVRVFPQLHALLWGHDRGH